MLRYGIETSDEIEEGLLNMGIPSLNYSFAGLREERELAAAEKTAASVEVPRKVEPVKSKPAMKPKKGY